MTGYYTEGVHGPHEYLDLGNFDLASGYVLPETKLAYKTIGTLNEAKDNAILLPHMYTGTPPFDRGAFPPVAISDDVRAQHKLVTEHFGIDQLAMVSGWSMGGQQTLEWAVRYPDALKRAVPFAATARNPDHCTVFCDLHMDALRSDPATCSSRPRTSRPTPIASPAPHTSRPAPAGATSPCSTCANRTPPPSTRSTPRP
jgi:homoserine O-acetyltransferase/O-succinyltransferase